MIDMLKRHEIQVLRRAGHTLAEVATLSGVSVGTVDRARFEAQRQAPFLETAEVFQKPFARWYQRAHRHGQERPQDR